MFIKKDPTWAQGLISAAKEVAQRTQYLVEVSNKVTMKEEKLEYMIAAVRAVGASTTRLVTASMVKAAPNSPARKRMHDASKAITKATTDLVENVQISIAEQEKAKEEKAMDLSGMSMTAAAKAKMDEDARIARLEIELEKARRLRQQANQQSYQGSGSQPAATGKMASSTAKAVATSVASTSTGLGSPKLAAPLKKTGSTGVAPPPASASGLAATFASATKYPLEDLKKFLRGGTPADVDVKNLELHLSEDEFKKVIQMPIDEWEKLVDWQKSKKKKAVGLG